MFVTKSEPVSVIAAVLATTLDESPAVSRDPPRFLRRSGRFDLKSFIGVHRASVSSREPSNGHGNRYFPPFRLCEGPFAGRSNIFVVRSIRNSDSVGSRSLLGRNTPSSCEWRIGSEGTSPICQRKLLLTTVDRYSIAYALNRVYIPYYNIISNFDIFATQGD